MKLWVDDIRQAPEGYKWCRSVNDAIQLIETSEKRVYKTEDIQAAARELHRIFDEMDASAARKELYNV